MSFVPGPLGGADAIQASDNIVERAAKPVTATAAFTAKANQVVLANATTAAFTVTLPAAASGISVVVKKTDATANIVTVAPAGGTIDGAANVTITAAQQARELISDGTNWFTI